LPFKKWKAKNETKENTKKRVKEEEKRGKKKAKKGGKGVRKKKAGLGARDICSQHSTDEKVSSGAQRSGTGTRSPTMHSAVMYRVG